MNNLEEEEKEELTEEELFHFMHQYIDPNDPEFDPVFRDKINDLCDELGIGRPMLSDRFSEEFKKLRAVLDTRKKK